MGSRTPQRFLDEAASAFRNRYGYSVRNGGPRPTSSVLLESGVVKGSTTALVTVIEGGSCLVCSSGHCPDQQIRPSSGGLGRGERVPRTKGTRMAGAGTKGDHAADGGKGCEAVAVADVETRMEPSQPDGTYDHTTSEICVEFEEEKRVVVDGNVGRER